MKRGRIEERIVGKEKNRKNRKKGKKKSRKTPKRKHAPEKKEI
jgi:hypothetical protein